MSKRELLEKITFGESIAEQEVEKLRDYFLETDSWKSLRNGTNDIIYGSKGAGKSAIYTNLTNDESVLFDEGILLTAGENPTGNTAFSNLTNDPPTSETEFVRLWKLYFLVITVNIFNDYGINDKYAKEVKQILIDCNLVPAQNKLASFLKACLDYARSFTNGKEISTTAEFDPLTGMYSGQKFSISFGEPSKSDFDKGLIPIEYAYDLLAKSLKENNIKLWVIIDRLDVAFIESEELETNALRALFKVYLDLFKFSEIKLKIFLRDDIWQRITQDGFREASHITKFQNLEWTKESLLNLLIRRILDNKDLIDSLNIDKNVVLSDFSKQEHLFYRLFPDQIDVGQKKPSTLDWILSRTRDGNGVNTPRELIQLFNHAKKIQLKRLENGINELDKEIIISRQSFKEAFDNVSKQRLEQTIYSEYSELKEYIEALRGGKAEHTIQTLMSKWNISKEDALVIAQKLGRIGFLGVKGVTSTPRYIIPFIYRPYLDITQGASTTSL